VKKLSRDDEAKICELAETLRKEWDAVDETKEAILEALNRYNEAVLKFNEHVGEARNFVVGLADKAQEYADERSERWQEGDAGSAYMAWIDEMQGLDLEDLEEVPIENLGLAEDPEYADALDELPREPEA